jgi:hypothetical protein
MADDRVTEARLIVAKRVISNALDADYPMAPEWSNYPEVGEADWAAVAQFIATHRAHLVPTDEEFEAAYDFLDARADAE